MEIFFQYSEMTRKYEAEDTLFGQISADRIIVTGLAVFLEIVALQVFLY